MRIVAMVLVSLVPLAAGANPLAGKKRMSVSFLPHGSQLQDVMFPRYDPQRNLIGSLKAEKMTLVDDNRIAGENLRIEFYHDDETLRGGIDLPKALIDQGKGVLRADGEIRMDSDRLTAQGRGLIYDYSTGEAFLDGPGIVVLKQQPQTSMRGNHRSFLRPVFTAGLLSVTAAIGAEKPAEVTKKGVAADLEASLAATHAVKTFIEAKGITGGEGATFTPAEKPLEVKDVAGLSRITFDGGVYSDLDAGLIVFLKNVKVDDPRFELSGANELKIFFTPKESGAKPGKTKGGGMPSFGGISGDIERIVASGAVRIVQRGAENGKEPVQASGAVFTYHPKSGTITLSGGYPWVMQGANYLRARQPNLTLRIEKNGDFHTSGQWDIHGKTN